MKKLKLMFSQEDYETNISDESASSTESAMPNYGKTFAITFGVLELVIVLGVVLWDAADNLERDFFKNHPVVSEISTGVGLSVAAALVFLAAWLITKGLVGCVEKYRGKSRIFSGGDSSYKIGGGGVQLTDHSSVQSDSQQLDVMDHLDHHPEDGL